MKILHIFREAPDETVKKIAATTTNGDESKKVELYKDEIDWSHLVDDIFSYDKVICWW